MATKFLDPGGDATFVDLGATGALFPASGGGNCIVVSDIVHGSHVRSARYVPASASQARTTAGVAILADSGTRISFYFYLVALPTATADIVDCLSGSSTKRYVIRLTSAGVIQMWNANTAQIGTDGATLSTGQWYRISLAYTVTSTSINRFELFVNGSSSISITNATLGGTGAGRFQIGNANTDTTLDARISDIYIDDSNSLTDTGNIWVTAKRPNANGTANNFTTQIGAGGSGYGSGHSPQVNERALSTTNGWSVVAAGVTVEEYNIEGKSTGDIDISTATIVDYVGWVYTSALLSETGQLILNNVNTAISITSTNTMFTAVAGSSTYPAGTGTDIGEQTDATATTVSLYECGVVVAYIPGSAVTTRPGTLSMMGVG